LGWVRLDNQGNINRLTLCHGQSIRIDQLSLDCRGTTEFIELTFRKNAATVVSGEPGKVARLIRSGKDLPLRQETEK